MADRTRRNDAPLAWGEFREMNASEALMWRIEVDPRLRSTITGLEILDCVPDWDRFLAACEWGTRMAPRFRQKVVEPALGIGTPRWVNDPDFDLHYHVRRIALPGGSESDLLSAAEQVAMTPFDRARSPWEAVLFEGLPDDRAAFLLKMHHSTTDGLGSVQLLSQLHSRQRESDPDKPQPVPPPPERATPFDVLREQVGNDLAAVPGLLRDGIRGGVGALASPVASSRSAARFAASLQRVLGDTGVAGSPLLRGRSLSWRFLALDVRFADLRAAAKSVGASLNDAFLAALLGAFRLYHEKLGRPIDRMPVAIPISVRTDDDAEGGNRFTGARFAGPAGIADPRERLVAIGEIVRSIRSEPALDAMSMLAPSLARLPAPLLAAVAGTLTQSNDLQASNVPGVREDRYLAGAKIERSYGFGPLPGCASMITMVSHRDLLCVGVNVDPAAVTEPELFGECLLRGFSEVLSLYPEAKAPVARF